MSQAKSNFISEYQGACIELLNALSHLRTLKVQYDALDYSSLVDGDFVDANAGITAAQLSSAVYSAGEFETLLNAGHKTNLYRMVV